MGIPLVPARPCLIDYEPASDEFPAPTSSSWADCHRSGNGLVVHGWDIARASGQKPTADPAAVKAAHGFLAAAGGPFGPVVAVPAERPLLDQVIGLAGRDPDWAPGQFGC